MASENRKFLVAVDFSKNSRQAFSYALKILSPKVVIALFSQDGGKVDFTETPTPFSGIFNQEALLKFQEEVSEKVEGYFKELEDEAREHGVIFEKRHEIGDPRETILEVAEKENVELIVVGSHGHGTLKRLVAGSVSTWLVNNSQLPVLVVKEKVADEGVPQVKSKHARFVPLGYWAASQL